MSIMTAEQQEQRNTLVSLGYSPKMLDAVFAPDEYAMLIQESLLDDLNPEDEDE